MSEAYDRLGSMEIIKTGNLLARKDDILSIFIPEISKKPLYFSVIILDDNDSYTEYEDKDLERLFVRLSTALNAGSAGTSTGNVGVVKIQAPGSYVFCFNYMVHIVGNRSNYVYSLLYNIAREPA